MGLESYELVDLTVEYGYDVAFCSKCRAEADIPSSQRQASITGISFAHCGSIVYQVVQCHTLDCNGRFFFKCSANSPALDMQNLILMPFKMGFFKYHEEAMWINPPENWHPKLKFKRSKDDQSYASVVMDESEFLDQLEKEYETGKIHLRRLCPNNQYYNTLFQLVPEPYLDFIDDKFKVVYDHIQKKGVDAFYSSIRLLLSQTTGKSIHEQIIQELSQKGYVDQQTEILETVESRIEQTIKNEIYLIVGQIYQIFLNPILNFERQVSMIFDKLFFSVCSDLYLSSRRKELSDWAGMARQGKALFIDAPMGLGKTYSIVDTLSSNLNLSAIVFFPTRRLCDDFCINLTNKLSELNHYSVISGDKVFMLNESGQMYEKCSNDYLNRNDIYYFEGINKYECDCYDDIIEQYSKHIFSKKAQCETCKKEENCRFHKHWEVAPEYRIIVATHAMYDQIFHNYDSLKWEKRFYKNLNRDFFIIDEDIIFSKCYQPISMAEKELREFIATITSFLNNPVYFEPGFIKKDSFFKIDSILSQFTKCDTTSYMPPIDHEFSFIDYIKMKWAERIYEKGNVTPDIINNENYVGDYLELIETAIQKGFVIQKFNLTSKDSSEKKAYFSNPKTFQFTDETPAHVFFDGTMMAEKLIEKKLIDAKFIKLPITIEEPFWEVRAWQNINTDLPKNRAYKNQKNVEKLLNEMIPELGEYQKFFILTSKTLRGKIEGWLKDAFPNTRIIIEHYGNLRGINTAKECNVGIVLGSYILSDAVEIAMSLDFISGKFKEYNPVPLKTLNHFWTWQGSKGSRKYKEEYEIIELISKEYRYSEYRQALARTRYLFHPVSFYVFSKDRIDDYEPFVKKIETDQYKNHIFPPRGRRKDNKDDVIKNAVCDWLKENSSVSITDIVNNYKELEIERHTIGKQLLRMYNEGAIELYKHYKKRYSKII